jgi:hypothetical protein
MVPDCGPASVASVTPVSRLAEVTRVACFAGSAQIARIALAARIVVGSARSRLL